MLPYLLKTRRKSSGVVRYVKLSTFSEVIPLISGGGPLPKLILFKIYSLFLKRWLLSTFNGTLVSNFRCASFNVKFETDGFYPISESFQSTNGIASSDHVLLIKHKRGNPLDRRVPRRTCYS